MKNCNIIKDLLPNYVEGLTSNDTNTFVKKHLEECEECRNLFNNTYKEDIFDNIEIDEKNLEDKDVKFLKNINKKMMRKALFLGVTIGLLILIIIYFSIIIYRFTIIENLSNKYASFQETSNMYLEINDNYIGDDLKFIENLKTQYWFKDNIIKIQQSSSKYDLYNIYTSYIDLEKNIIYSFNHKDKTVEIRNRENILKNNEIFEKLNSKYKDNLKDKIKLSLSRYTSIYNKNDYSIITNWGIGSYIYDSKTGLLNMSYFYEYTGNNNNLYNHHLQTYTYNTDSVTDNDISMPDISNYTIIN